MEFRIVFTEKHIKRLLLGLIASEVVLVLIYLASRLLGSPFTIFFETFNLDGEANVPAWFSSIQLFVIGIVFWLQSPRVPKSGVLAPAFLLLLGAGFIFLSLDEAAEIHETISQIIRVIDWVPRFKHDFGSWILLYLLIPLIIFLITFRQFKAMWDVYRRQTFIMATGVGVFLLSAVGLEIISYQFLRDGTHVLLYVGEVAVEEFLEMFGASLILYGVLSFSHTVSTSSNKFKAAKS